MRERERKRKRKKEKGIKKVSGRDTDTRVSTAFWFRDGDDRKENFELCVEKTRVFASKDLGNERPPNTQQMRCDVQSLQQTSK
jgi:hypothetical protein